MTAGEPMDAQREITYDGLDGFIDAMKREGVVRLACAEIREKRATQVEPNVLSVVDLSRLEILAYRRPTIHKCAIDTADFAAVYERLRAQGFEITRRSRNIT
ncbi:MAG TPA: hypothetical protein PKM65_18760 [Spirochaetota bacterium]|nr:hypothetical protein [Spirochaetota bacterium]HNT11448.1 hypothetical protein [Spirochaetota bacterium]HNV49078.1 hypothetical protein [Spirochaetota bacterium]HOS40293.1 hypothetical protein [Spirochaetota bacterium]HPI22665.1 hypothetical protein [Spirochaetota bacterium]